MTAYRKRRGQASSLKIVRGRTELDGVCSRETMPDPTTLDAILSATLAQRLDETLLWLCAIPSPTGEEKLICDEVEARLGKLSCVGTTLRVGNSLVAPVVAPRLHARDPLAAANPDDRRRPRVALVGHLDTVRTENGPPRIAEGRCFGAGASDMKSGLALMLVLAETIPPEALGCDLTLVFYAREEGPFADNELGEVFARCPDLDRIDVAVCLEPSDNRLHLGCNGSIHASVTFEGKTGHSARPWEGENAIHKAASFLTDLGSRRPVEHRIDDLVYRTVTSATQAKDGGRGRNVVPDRFTLNLNHRFAPSSSLEAAQREVLELVGGRASVEFTDLSPAAPPNRNHALVGALLRAGAKGPEPKQAWTDVARFASKGIAAVNFGPGENAQAHQKNESTSIALLHEGYAILRKWLTSVSAG
jgi:succinyl-diaminopimelate desuccinylase